ncbi:HAD family hydrolase [Amnibacterium sp. CER49]|uniref:HAD family hydrolase n=1 Tax=Amnibacterium sp. CER49 TaxID=3039161 RepID=UPI00244740E5|nr:HAD family hydrolase [Amnibacterium sp. CER49]MDH2445378.1 HAD family hydrolase [Amnibacterium sp. CER49]
MSDPRTLYVSDLDGTLLGDDGRISERSLTTIGALLERGDVAFTVATARSYATARRAIAELPIRLPMVVYSGAFAVDPDTGERRWQVLFAPATVPALLEEAVPLGLVPVVFWLQDGRERMSWVPGGEPSGLARWLEARRGDPRLLPVERWDEVDTSVAFFVSVVGPAAALERLVAALEGAPAGEDCALAFQPSATDPDRSVLDVTAAAATKAEAVLRVAREAGFDRVEAFGDGPNDMPLFEEADEAHAVANADAAVLEAATDVIPPNVEDGVAAYLVAEAAEGARDPEADGR